MRYAARMSKGVDLSTRAIFGGPIVVALFSGCVAPQKTDGNSHGVDEAITMIRVADQTCDDPGGWSNLFFENDSLNPGTDVALFAELAPDQHIEVVRHRSDNGQDTYLVRPRQGALEIPLEFTAGEGERCATSELPLPPLGPAARIQIAITDDHVYGRIAEHREGAMLTKRGPVRIEVRPRTRRALRFDRLTDLLLFVDSDRDGEIRSRTALDSTGRVQFGEEVGEVFVLDDRRFKVDSLSAQGTRLYLENASNAAAPFRGFQAPPFAGTDLDGIKHQLADHAGRLVVLEFWSTECPFSEQARPAARRMAVELEARGGVYLSMARESDMQVIRAHLDEHPLDGTVLAREDTTWQQWNPQTVTPLFFVIAPDGTVVLREIGASAVTLAAAAAGLDPTGLLGE